MRLQILAFIPFYFLPYDSLTYILGFNINNTAQTLPATAIFSPFYLIIRLVFTGGLKYKSCVKSIPLGIFALLSVVTIGNVIYEYGFSNNSQTIELRSVAAPRQGISLMLGIASFYMFSDALYRVPFTRVIAVMLIGALPSLLAVCIQTLLGDYRVQGFSSEPAHFADYVVWVILPACLLLKCSNQIRYLLILLAISALALTFSSTGYIKAFCLLILYLFTTRKSSTVLLFMLVILIMFCVVLYGYSDNYVLLVLENIYNDYTNTGTVFSTNGSLIDRYFGFFGPISLLYAPHSWFGYGFGGDSVYFDQLFSEDIAKVMYSVKNDIPSISSLQGKMLMYGGLVGYGLYLLMWYRSLRNTDNSVLRSVLLALFGASFFSMGPFFLPYVWFWLALATSNIYRLAQEQ